VLGRLIWKSLGLPLKMRLKARLEVIFRWLLDMACRQLRMIFDDRIRNPTDALD
jgi:hypothetical protein